MSSDAESDLLRFEGSDAESDLVQFEGHEVVATSFVLAKILGAVGLNPKPSGPKP